MATRTLIDVKHLGLGEILRTFKLSVPPNQREYSWTDKEVMTLLQDFAGAIHEKDADYFLGTIVVVSKGADSFEIVDGQQRLATTTILLAAIRDFLQPSEPEIAGNFDRQYLTAPSRNMRESEPRMRLNLTDNQFFEALVAGKLKLDSQRASHQRILDAYDRCLEQVKRVVAPHDTKKHADLLVEWASFVKDSAQVVLLIISSDGNAYRMFETLNDRGLKTTQADLVKNYLFGHAGDRHQEAQDKWSSMRGALEALDEDRVPTVTYLRHALMLKRGYFRENALHDNVQKEAKSAAQVIRLLESLESFAADYSALFNPESERWNGYPDSLRGALRALDLLNIAGMRPLMMAVASKVTKKEAAAAFAKFVSWQVRYLISGSTLTGGYIEVPLAAAAKKVFDGEISNVKSLSAEMAPRLPPDDQFARDFSEATVSKAALARYYLRTLERCVNEEKEAAFIPNDDREAINLEHVLPIKPMGNWPSFSEEEARADAKRLGNMVLLQAKKNSDLKSSSFDDKKVVFGASPYVLTSQLAALPAWTHEAVAKRQHALAKIALKAWPL